MYNFAAITLLPLSVTVVGAIFSIVLLNRYFSGRRRTHELVWGIAFAMFAIAAGCQVYADLNGGWTVLSARLFYLFGAILNVGFLGVGTVYLLFSKRVANIALAVMLVFSAVAAIVVFTAPVNEALLQTEQGYAAVVTPAMRIMAGISNGIGTILLVGGALWSGIVFWRKRIMKHRMIGVFLIAGGALIVASAGTIVGLFGLKNFEYHSIGILIGVIIMFVGYLESIRVTQPQAQVSERAAVTSTTAR